jgi:hypothetical protein
LALERSCAGEERLSNPLARFPRADSPLLTMTLPGDAAFETPCVENTQLSRGAIHAFEPVPAIFAGLERNVTRHNRLDVHLHNVGASARDERVDFTFYPLTSSSSSRHPLDSAEANAVTARRSR